MKKIAFTALLVLTAFSLGYAGIASAQGTGKLPVVRIGTISDGAHKYLSTEIRDLIEREVLALTRGEFEGNINTHQRIQKRFRHIKPNKTVSMKILRAGQVVTLLGDRRW